jgi:hypothetical protein
VFIFPESILAGQKGGKSRSLAKKKAARKNGQNGGRTPTRSLAERLLRQKLNNEQKRHLYNAWTDGQIMLEGEKKHFLDYFSATPTYINPTFVFPITSTFWRRKTRRPPKEVKFLIRKFRLGARYYLNLTPETKP